MSAIAATVEAVDDLGCAPFLKWVGGKRKLLPTLLPLLPVGVERMRHVEPFLGGGAMFFSRAPRGAALSDVNSDLIETYRAVRDLPDVVLGRLRVLARDHDEATYYAVRGAFNARSEESGPWRAAQFIYLNKTCFNGLFRVNRKGEFNVPAGKYTNPAIADADALLVASACLRGVSLRCAPFEVALRDVGEGDFVYLDPPYAPVSDTSNFTSYTQGGFAGVDQVRLAAMFRFLDRRGAKVMLSNSDVPLTRKLYSGYTVDVIQAARSINSDASKRGAVNELVVRNYVSRAEAAPEQLKLGEP